MKDYECLCCIYYIKGIMYRGKRCLQFEHKTFYTKILGKILKKEGKYKDMSN